MRSPLSRGLALRSTGKTHTSFARTECTYRCLDTSYDQGVMSSLLTANQFQKVFPQVVVDADHKDHATLQSFLAAIHVSEHRAPIMPGIRLMYGFRKSGTRMFDWRHCKHMDRRYHWTSSSHRNGWYNHTDRGSSASFVVQLRTHPHRARHHGARDWLYCTSPQTTTINCL